MNRIQDIVNYLLENPKDLVAVLYGRASLLNVDEIELEAIKKVFKTNSSELI